MEGDWQALMTDFVVDASVACGWVLPDETSAVGEAAYAYLERHSAFSPDLLWHEVRNVLMMTYRRKRIDFGAVTAGVEKLRILPIRTRHDVANDYSIITLAERHGLTAYDATYLALAVEMKLPLATLDKQLITAATRDGVPLIE